MRDKYQLHQTLYRQSQALLRDAQVAVSGSTLGDAVMAAGPLLLPIHAAQRQELLTRDYLQADETPAGVQSEQAPPGQNPARGNGNTARPAERSSSTFK